MLKRFKIQDFVIIPQAELHLAAGLNVISGETGAGKSMVLEALTAVCGGKINGKIIRSGAEEALLEAEFSDGLQWQRRIRPRSSQIICQQERLSQQALQQLSRERLSLYGQHQNHELLRPEAQRFRLDRYGHWEMQSLRQAWQQWKQAEQALQLWETEQAQWQAQQALWQYQVQELEQIAPQPDEFQQLSAQQEALSQAEWRLQHGAQLQQLLETLSEQSKQALKQAQQGFPELSELCEQALIHHQEALLSLNKALYAIENEPETLQRIEARMAVLHQLARKHRCAPEALPQLWQDLKQQLAQAEAENGEALRAAVVANEALYRQEAAKISQLRRESAPILAAEMVAILQQLGMERAQLQIEIKDCAASIYGCDAVQFWVSFNAGQALQPLQNVASGGELSRFSLALEVATLGEQPVATIIFDEVDSGIGGQVAHTIGRLLQRLGEKQQVICITHLAQVACYAERHFAIEKSHHHDETRSQIKMLDDDERIQELARMLGNPHADSSLKWAETLWREAQESAS